ncbi:RNA polymerase-associated protein CTR9, partial [Fasciolopsis buskii]
TGQEYRALSAENSIEIPLRGGDEVIELDTDQLPEGEEVLNILNQEKAPLQIWTTVAVAYYKKKLFDDFEKILEEAYRNAAELQPYHESDLVRLLDMLANYYGRKAYKEKSKEKKNQLIAQATRLFTSADRIDMYDQKHLLGRAFFFIYEGENWSQADSQLNFVLNQGTPSVPAYLGKACIAFNKKEYRNALGFYRKALRLQPNCPATVRLGMGHCFFKLGNMEKARLAFQRALDLDPDCVGALVGLAILDLNEKTQESIKQGVQKLSRAYNLDPTNPMVLNHLADHFFYKKEYAKVHRLAIHAFHNTETEAMRAESCYQMARAFHMQENYDNAFQYYYLATQMASQNFILPFYGLGQMYLHRNDLEHAAVSFERVLKDHPTNYETLKILGSLYAQSTKPDKRAHAKQLFKQVTESQPEDVEAWIEYAQLLEHDVSGALDAYLKALAILENIQLDMAPEILNNIGCLYYMKNDLDQAVSFFSRADERIQEEQQHEEQERAERGAATNSAQPDDYYHGLGITVRYNRARLHEAQGRPDLAEEIYKSILLKHPSYIDCYLRLGCIARDRGQIWDASIWFKDALDVDPDSPDVWSLIGLLHLNKNEVEQAQKKFDRIIRQPAYRADAFARISLGNIWLTTLHHPIRDKDKRKRHQDRALSFYKAVLCADPRNIWAAHGIGCVLAHKGFVNEARDVFAQVREATAEFADVWINIAHIYVEQKQYTAAIQMYENCIRKFGKQNNTELLQYLARAHFKAGQLKECKTILLKAMHVKPWDPLLTFNLALVHKRLAVTVLQDETSSFSLVCEVIADLNMARCTFDHLSKANDSLNQAMAADEARACQDLLSQAEYHLDRARSREEQERVVRKRQEEEREAQRKRQLELQQQAEQMRLERERRLEEERGRFLEKAKQIVIEPVAEERKGRRGGGAGGRRRDDFIASGDEESASSASGPDNNEGRDEGTEGGRSGKSKTKQRSGKRRSADASASIRKKARLSSSRDDGLTAKQRMRIVSKAIVSDSSDSSSSDDDDQAREDARVAALAKKILSSDEDDHDQPVEELLRPTRGSPSPSSSDLSDHSSKRQSRHGGKAHRFAKAPRKSHKNKASSRGQARRMVASSEEESEGEPRRPSGRSRRPVENSASEDEHSQAEKRSRVPAASSDEDEDSEDAMTGTAKRKRMLASSGSESEEDSRQEGGNFNARRQPSRSPSPSQDNSNSQQHQSPHPSGSDEESSVLSQDDSS